MYPVIGDIRSNCNSDSKNTCRCAQRLCYCYFLPEERKYVVSGNEQYGSGNSAKYVGAQHFFHAQVFCKNFSHPKQPEQVKKNMKEFEVQKLIRDQCPRLEN